MNLAQKKCIPCEAGTPPLSQEEADELLKEIPGWELTEKGRLARKFKFQDFGQALSFVNQVGRIAEEEGHHPDIKIVYNRVTLELITHAIGGLSENDFILAAKVNKLTRQDE